MGPAKIIEGLSLLFKGDFRFTRVLLGFSFVGRFFLFQSVLYQTNDLQHALAIHHCHQVEPNMYACKTGTDSIDFYSVCLVPI